MSRSTSSRGRRSRAPKQPSSRRCPPASASTAFFALWTRKESIVKALGIGITDDFAAASAQSTGAVVHDLACAAGYVAALAVLGRCDRITVSDATALVRRPP